MKSIRILVATIILVAMGWVSSSKAQTLSTIYTFCLATNVDGNCVDGAFPQAIFEISPGLFLGSTEYGGVSNDGTAFLLTSAGSLTTIYQFNDHTGTQPQGCFQSINGVIQAVQANDGSFFGTTVDGGTGGSGTVARLTSQGTLTLVHQFSGSDGSDPRNLIKASDGNFYGDTAEGGSNGSGTVYRLTSAGTLTTIHNFAGLDGDIPTIDIQSSNDNQLYGSTQKGGTNNAGTIFKMTTAGTLTTLHSFNRITEGVFPTLTLQSGDNFYGTLIAGGTHGSGTVFQITSTGALTNLYQFSGPDGSEPIVLYMDADQTLYGVTASGGANGAGTAFKLTSQGTLTTLYSFCNDPDCTDGNNPSQFTLASDGKFYGVTVGGGFTNLNGGGTAFVLDAGVIVGSCTYGLNPTNAAFTATGGTGSFNVTSTNICPWAATNNESFITITSGTPGSGTGTVHYSVAPNTSASSLTGTITVAGETFTVTESGTTSSGCTFTLSKTSITLKAKGGKMTVSVKAKGTGCDWTASTTNSWITITSGSSGTGSGKVEFTVPGNTNTAALSGAITIAGDTYTVNQDAGGCTYKLSPKDGKLKDTGGTATIKVTPNLSDCDWTAVSNDSFITITSGASGTGKGTVTYSVPANATSNILTGSVAVAGQTFTVIQAGVKAK